MTDAEFDMAFIQTQRARAAQKKAEAERDAVLKFAYDLQLLHDLATEWESRKLSYSDNAFDFGLVYGVSFCLKQLTEAIAKLQSAGEVKS